VKSKGQFRSCLCMDVCHRFKVSCLNGSSDINPGPGTFVEVLKVAPFLIKPLSPESPSFHIIAPSLPNFGFSQGISKRGFALAQYAETCQKLMLQLGYPEYATQAGDWGFWITRAIGRLYPQSCRASHLNMIYAQPPTFTKNPILKLQSLITPYTENERKALERKHWFQTESRGKLARI
jgi:pimeloyl-ACP methyl ester carboxylesterase